MKTLLTSTLLTAILLSAVVLLVTQIKFVEFVEVIFADDVSAYEAGCIAGIAARDQSFNIQELTLEPNILLGPTADPDFIRGYYVCIFTEEMTLYEKFWAWRVNLSR